MRKQHHGKEVIDSVAHLIFVPVLFGDIGQAVEQANQAVSHAESIRKFRILPVDFTVLTGELTPTLKVKRNVVTQRFASEIEAIYANS